MIDVIGYRVRKVPTHAQLIWNCRRGMLELDLILNRLIDHYLPQMKDEELILFEQLLNYSDPELYAYLMGQAFSENQEINHFVEQIRAQYTF